MKETTTKWTCNRCRKEFDDDELIPSRTNNIYQKRGTATFIRKHTITDIGGQHVTTDEVDLCASCAEIVELVITGSIS